MSADHTNVVLSHVHTLSSSIVSGPLSFQTFVSANVSVCFLWHVIVSRCLSLLSLTFPCLPMSLSSSTTANNNCVVLSVMSKNRSLLVCPCVSHSVTLVHVPLSAVVLRRRVLVSYAAPLVYKCVSVRLLYVLLRRVLVCRFPSCLQMSLYLSTVCP